MSHESAKPSNLPAVRRPPSSAAVAFSRSAPAQGGELANVLSLPFFLWVFKQWWKIGIPAGLVMAAAAGAAVIYTFEPKYEASRVIVIEDSRPQLAFSSGVGDQGQSFVQTQLQLLQGRDVFERVLKVSKIAKAPQVAGQLDPSNYLKNFVKVRRLGGSDMYSVSCISNSPQFAADVANEVVEQYYQMQKEDEGARLVDFKRALEAEVQIREEQVRASARSS